MRFLISLLAVTLFAAFMLIGCESSTSPLAETPRLQLRLQAKTSSLKANPLLKVTSQNLMVIEEVKFFVDEMTLDGTHGTEDFELKKFIVNLPLDGTPLTINDQAVPAGFYDEFELEIEKPDDDAAVNDPDFKDATGKYSVVVKGKYNGADFTFRSKEDFEIKIDLDPALEIKESGNSILVLTVDFSRWFKGLNGDDLDPGDPMNTGRINENIEKSFEAFKEKFDDDDDDDDDD